MYFLFIIVCCVEYDNESERLRGKCTPNWNWNVLSHYHHLNGFRIIGRSTKRLKYFGHVTKMRRHRNPKIAIEGQVQGGRPLKDGYAHFTCIFFTFNRLTLTSEMHFEKFHPEIASCILSRSKRKYAPLGMRLLWKYINDFLVYHLTSHFLFYLQTTKNLKLKFLICK